MRSGDKTATVASLLALASLGVISARQLGALGHLPDLPGEVFQSDELTTSEDSKVLGLPDGPLGLGSFGLTLLLVSRGSDLTKYKAAFDLLYALSRSGGTYLKKQQLCGWCLVALGASAVSTAALWRQE
ncbi:hypothetical protein DKM44_05580 [Deinococcus irradiatisoli]|uniref:Vitamin K epoxide reductase domain-containing protein n=1 Tax=Deinococcus irradiatisoli TaxID=2202254 RepID=A0A2Z3JCV1_9DEIO|nr:hypothetical protein [Deinococcus irradiatisoli]AWN22765.1 hypothetical protein DKM44_05580 [Deinococcus irradiatisoli]